MTDATDDLAKLEKNIHAADLSNSRHHRAKVLEGMHGDDPKKAAEYAGEAAKHADDRDASLKAHDDSGVTDRDIDLAAQSVIDERGEGHTEKNILPEDLGKTMIVAGKAYAEYRSTANLKALENATAAYEAARTAHADASHNRSKAGAA